ncbi:MAG: stalk domain-containing protein [Caldisericota bacterium]|nr:stalk domain-containing protein [Caldisericota bacterium]
MKGICVRGEDIEKLGAKEVVLTLKEYGYNTIFLLVKNPQGRVFYKSEFLPVESDILGTLINEAHYNDIKVFTYFPVFMDKNFGFLHQEELMQHINGSKNNYYVSLLSSVYLDYIKHFLDELLQYDIDGVSLDYIRFPNGSYDFSNASMQYAQENGIDTNKVKNIAYKTFVNPADWKSLFEAYEQEDEDVVRWINLRNNLVKDEASIVKEYIKSIQPNINVGAFMVARGFRYKTTEKAEKISDSLTYQVVNFGQLSTTFSGFDFIAPMVYLSSLQENSSYATLVIKTLKSDLTNIPVYTAVNPFNISSEETEKELFYAFQYGEGAILFRFPLFSMGDWTFSSKPVPQEEIIANIKINSGKESSIALTMKQQDFVPLFGDTVFLGPFLKYISIKFVIDSTTLFKNGTGIQMDTSPFIKDSRTFVPVRFISENLGAKVSWDGEKREVMVEMFKEF